MLDSVLSFYSETAKPVQFKFFCKYVIKFMNKHAPYLCPFFTLHFITLTLGHYLRHPSPPAT